MNWLLFASVVVIGMAGILFINGASYLQPQYGYWQNQAKFLGFGLVVFLIISMVDYRWIKWAAAPLFLLSIGLMALTYTSLGREVNGARCWLQLPGLQQFQPSQLMILAGILVLALFLSACRSWHPALKLLGAGVIVAPAMILILTQHDYGMTLVWVPVVGVVLWLAKLPLRWLALVTLIALTALPLVINFGLKQHARDRIVTFINPDADPRGTGYAVNQSLIAVGSAGFRGKGFKAQGTQLESKLITADEAHTDYIFTTIAEQWGFLGGAALIAAFAVLLCSCLLTAFRASEPFGLLVVGGIVAQVFFHVYQNIGMTIALMPVTGLPLPLVSYGGTFALVLMFSLGLVNSVWIHRNAGEEAGE